MGPWKDQSPLVGHASLPAKPTKIVPPSGGRKDRQKENSLPSLPLPSSQQESQSSSFTLSSPSRPPTSPITTARKSRSKSHDGSTAEKPRTKSPSPRPVTPGVFKSFSLKSHSTSLPERVIKLNVFGPQRLTLSQQPTINPSPSDQQPNTNSPPSDQQPTVNLLPLDQQPAINSPSSVQQSSVVMKTRKSAAKKSKTPDSAKVTTPSKSTSKKSQVPTASPVENSQVSTPADSVMSEVATPVIDDTLVSSNTDGFVTFTNTGRITASLQTSTPPKLPLYSRLSLVKLKDYIHAKKVSGNLDAYNAGNFSLYPEEYGPGHLLFDFQIGIVEQVAWCAEFGLYVYFIGILDDEGAAEEDGKKKAEMVVVAQEVQLMEFRRPKFALGAAVKPKETVAEMPSEMTVKSINPYLQGALSGYEYELGEPLTGVALMLQEELLEGKLKY